MLKRNNNNWDAVKNYVKNLMFIKNGEKNLIYFNKVQESVEEFPIKESPIYI